MKNFRPLLLEDLQVESSGLEVIRLCVNQHLPEAEWVRTHRHDFSQCLLYLSGHGVQQVDDTKYSVSAGSLICVPSGIPHAFEKRSSRVPLCLVVDFKILDSEQIQQSATRLNGEDLTVLRQRLSWLMSVPGTRGDIAIRAREAATVLDVAGILLGASIGNSKINQVQPMRDKLLRLIANADLQTMTVAQLVKRAGLQKDHLNRLLKRECGLTVSHLLAEVRLEKAKSLLSDPNLQIQDAGSGSGFEDRNYFARWFRKQTGQSPRDWRNDLLSH